MTNHQTIDLSGLELPENAEVHDDAVVVVTGADGEEHVIRARKYVIVPPDDDLGTRFIISGGEVLEI